MSANECKLCHRQFLPSDTAPYRQSTLPEIGGVSIKTKMACILSRLFSGTPSFLKVIGKTLFGLIGMGIGLTALMAVGWIIFPGMTRLGLWIAFHIFGWKTMDKVPMDQVDGWDDLAATNAMPHMCAWFFAVLCIIGVVVIAYVATFGAHNVGTFLWKKVWKR